MTMFIVGDRVRVTASYYIGDYVRHNNVCIVRRIIGGSHHVEPIFGSMHSPVLVSRKRFTGFEFIRVAESEIEHLPDSGCIFEGIG